MMHEYKTEFISIPMKSTTKRAQGNSLAGSYRVRIADREE